MNKALVVLVFLLGLAAVRANGQSPAAAGAGPKDQSCYVHYPNIPGETLLENDRLVVQKFVVQPGQWEGLHSHPGNQLFVHLKGGKWAVRYGDKETVSVSPDGSVGWYDRVNLSQKHQSGNVGEEPIELLWITLKPCDASPAKN
jgi:mannose-6-phosphate isomerase-like protein (cupin superfamily)